MLTGLLAASQGHLLHRHLRHVDDHFEAAQLAGCCAHDRRLLEIVERDVGVEEHARDIPHRVDDVGRTAGITNHDLGPEFAKPLRAGLVARRTIARTCSPLPRSSSTTKSLTTPENPAAPVIRYMAVNLARRGPLGGPLPLWPSSEPDAAYGPRAPALPFPSHHGDSDLLFSGGQVGTRRVTQSAVVLPGVLVELDAAVEAVAGIDGPVAGRLTRPAHPTSRHRLSAAPQYPPWRRSAEPTAARVSRSGGPPAADRLRHR